MCGQPTKVLIVKLPAISCSCSYYDPLWFRLCMRVETTQRRHPNVVSLTTWQSPGSVQRALALTSLQSCDVAQLFLAPLEDGNPWSLEQSGKFLGIRRAPFD